MTQWQQGLYALTDEHLMPDDATLIDRCEAALDAGIALLQYRDKSGDEGKRERQARALKALCDHYDTPLIINDDAALAWRLGVGLHLGRSDGSIVRARKALGPEAIIGATCQDSLEFAEQSAGEGASYLAFGRFYPSRTKPDAPPADLAILAQVARFNLPRVAIGGIDADNIDATVSAGADLIALVHGIFGHDDPGAAVRRLNQAMKR
ncbi:thiamine phosphate synthase [Kushneria marisflavi]|uniref:Thiamine-phosphate synthase n=1 Tax=Kushneria marisflavi TaxID=157779 RepID=A0A240UQ82_9GAMM|nr:thiamine phosphate synthase [Kushneria marisflavi]ART63275.1 thiamine-phosphate diphosphorylase [Kushneria marisflavi]RKD84307.1 thiamine-phosphate diphosphorylase [Kushneria marisflavi]